MIAKQIVYLSYARDDKNETSISREKIVDEVHKSLEENGFDVHRDSVNIKYRDSILKFMKEIGEADCIITFISDEYLKSPYCMFELLDIYRKSNSNFNEMKEKVFPIILNDAKIYRPEGRKAYVEHWVREAETQSNSSIGIRSEYVTKTAQEVKVYRDIALNIDDLLDWLKDLYTLTPEELSKDNFLIVRRSIKLLAAVRAKNKANRWAIAAMILAVTVLVLLIIANSERIEASKANEKNKKLVNAFYFYKDSFALAFKNDKFGFINKNGDPVVDYEYDDAEQFDYVGLAKVKKRIEGNNALTDYLINTNGDTFRVAYRINDLQPDVVALDLRNTKLNSLPKGIFSHRQLKILLATGEGNLYKKQFVIPDSLFGLQSLQCLALVSFGINHLPPAIGNLTNLTSLLLSSNKNLSSLPSSIQNLANLETLDLTYNDSLISLPPEIEKLYNLRNLYLSNNTNLESLPETLWNLKNLQHLNVSHTKLRNLSTAIGGLSSLTELYLDHNKSLHSLPSNVWDIRSLNSLNLDSTDLSNSSIDEIGNLVNLINLNLSNTNLKKLPSNVGKMSNLKSLYVIGNRNLNTLPPELWNCVELTDLGLSRTGINNITSKIQNLTNLTTLYLSSTEIKTLPSEIGKLDKLTVLYLDHNPNLIELPDEIEKLTNLRILYLNDDKSLKLPLKALGKMTNLKFLYLNGTPILSLDRQKLQSRLPHCRIVFN